MSNCLANSVKVNIVNLTDWFTNVSVTDSKRSTWGIFKDLELPLTLHAKNVDYRLERNAIGLDSVECAGQVIPVPQSVPQGTLQRIGLLGYSSWGDFKEALTVEYADQTKMEYAFGFLNMCSEEHNMPIDCLMDQEADIWGFPCERYAFFDSNLEWLNQISLYQSVVQIDASKPVASLTLPENPLMTILAISLF